MIQMDAKNNMTGTPVVVICIHMSAMSYGTGTHPVLLQPIKTVIYI